MLRFILALLLCATVLITGVFLALHFEWIQLKPSFFSEILIFLFIVTLVIFRYLNKVSKPDYFVQLFLLTLVVKILAAFALALVMIIYDPAGVQANVVFLLIAYTLFTALETAFLFRQTARKKGHQ